MPRLTCDLSPLTFFQIIIPCPSEPCTTYKDSRPQALQIQISQVFITNSRTGYKSTQTDMLVFLQPFLGSKLYTNFENFPAMSGDVQPLPNSSWVNDCSLLANSSKIDKHLNGVCQDTFGTHRPSQVSFVWIIFIIVIMIMFKNHCYCSCCYGSCSCCFVL